MKQPKRQMSYRQTVAWIALNDEPTERDRESIAGYISTCLAADIFGVTTEAMAFDIYMYRTGARTRGDVE